MVYKQGLRSRGDRTRNCSAFCFLDAPHHNGSVDRLSVLSDEQGCIENSCGPERQGY